MNKQARTGVPSDGRATTKSETVRLKDDYFYSSLSFFLDSWMNCHHLCSSTKRSTKKHWPHTSAFVWSHLKLLLSQTLNHTVCCLIVKKQNKNVLKGAVKWVCVLHWAGMASGFKITRCELWVRLSTSTRRHPKGHNKAQSDICYFYIICILEWTLFQVRFSDVWNPNAFVSLKRFTSYFYFHPVLFDPRY